ncbi:hypothetical protein [Pseudomonas citronellolis]|uniref:hypothetical protein n=1 Tax=Pseudomonas citronellolis TaxID=53408 RepID=UPI0021BF1C15|nr:hypothetical protein [Pseudomonas citronellolis]UXJ54876.1 hypothetical protein N5P21_11970 [Pseudomonas citronellolis]
MKKVPAAPSALSNFFRNTSDAAKRAAYSSASSSAIESQRRVIEEARNLKEAREHACA